MGFGMATNVRKNMSKDATLFIHDVDPAWCERFVTEMKDIGPFEIVNTSKEAASRSSSLISIVPAADHVRKVFLDEEEGVLAAAEDPDRLILCCSTIDAETTREVGKAIADAGQGRYIDAPLSVSSLGSQQFSLYPNALYRGWQMGAAAGTLSFMIGCFVSDPQTHRIREVVSLMADPDKIYFCGQLGSGNAAKISNNYMAGTIGIALSEAMAIGIRSGVDAKVLNKIISNSTGQTW